jgi:hypothetical protein
MNFSSDIIGNRTCDLPACRAVPQPTVPPRAPLLICTFPMSCAPRLFIVIAVSLFQILFQSLHLLMYNVHPNFGKSS